jgi:hypothetical protein
MLKNLASEKPPLRTQRRPLQSSERTPIASSTRPAIAAIVVSGRDVSPSVSIVAAVAVANRKDECYAPSMSELLFS